MAIHLKFSFTVFIVSSLLHGAIAFQENWENEESSAKFESWMVRYGKIYADDAEKHHKFQNFKANCRLIDEHNELDCGQFADLDVGEFISYLQKGKMKKLESDVDRRSNGAVATAAAKYPGIQQMKETNGVADEEKSRRPMEQNENDTLMILSLDGGGVRGIILCVYLIYLETMLQKLDGKHVRLADYFNLIAGVSTGGLIAAMLVVLNEEGRPKFEARDILDYYLKHAPKIFPPISCCRWRRVIKNLFRPKYDGIYHRAMIWGTLKETRLNDRLGTGLFIRAYDMKQSKAVNFLSLKMKPQLDAMNAMLADICIGTSAAPTYLPSHPFSTKGRDFNLIDGAVKENNPTYSVIEELKRDSTMNGLRLSILSLGTGSKDIKDKYADTKTSGWGILKWLCPLKEILLRSPSHAVDADVYMRIQGRNLSGDMVSMDLATEKNLKDLQEFADESLKLPMTENNPGTSKIEADPFLNITTNEDGLKWFADLLRKNKLQKKEPDVMQDHSDPPPDYH